MKKHNTTICMLVILFAVALQTFGQEEVRIKRPAQITFFSPIGTNGMEGENCVNNLSINMVWGISAGVNGIELGGIGNSVKDFVRGAQFAGIFNTVDGDFTGVQASGLLNFVKGNFLGIQLSDFGNFNGGDLTGLQLAGFMNIANDVKFLQLSGFLNSANRMKGIQAAGFMNTADEFTGVQLGGFLNTSEKALGVQHAGFINISRDILGCQVSGFMNVADEATGFQAGGFMNVAEELKGVQTAGFMNVAGNVKGVQSSGFLNIAKDLKGLQLGVINICDTVSRGVPLGLLSIVNKGGYRTWELGSSDSWTGQISYRIGINRLYSIFPIGARFHKNAFYWGYGFGLGTRLSFSDYLKGSLEVTAMQILEATFVVEDMDLLTTFRFNLEGSIGGGVSWYAGPTFNIMLARYEYPDNETIWDNFAPWTVYDKVSGISRTKMWPGIAAGIRF